MIRFLNRGEYGDCSKLWVWDQVRARLYYYNYKQVVVFMVVDSFDDHEGLTGAMLQFPLSEKVKCM